MPRNTKKIREWTDKILAAARDIGVASMTAHPVVIALGIMATCNAARSLIDERTRPDILLDGLYVDARNLGIAAATVPVVTGTLNLLQQALATR